jgi:hypothetical protein
VGTNITAALSAITEVSLIDLRPDSSSFVWALCHMASPKFAHACTWVAVAVVLVWSSAVTAVKQNEVAAQKLSQSDGAGHDMDGVATYRQVLTCTATRWLNCGLIAQQHTPLKAHLRFKRSSGKHVLTLMAARQAMCQNH